MPSNHKHRKVETDHKSFKRFSCLGGPKHYGCGLGDHTACRRSDHQGRIMWEVQWRPCREKEAIAYMKEEHGYTYHPGPSEGRKKPVHKSHGHGRPKEQGTLSAPDLGQQTTAAALAASRRQEQHHHHQMQPPATFATITSMPLGTREQQNTRSRIQAWMAGNTASDPDTAFGQGTVPPQGAAGAQNMAPAPVMPLPGATPGRQQQRRHHQRRHRPTPEQGPQPPVPVMPDATAPPAVASAPVMSPPPPSPDGVQHRRRRHRKSGRGPGPGPEPEPWHELEEDQQPPWTVPPNCMLASVAALASAAGPELEMAQPQGPAAIAPRTPMPPPTMPAPPATQSMALRPRLQPSLGAPLAPRAETPMAHMTMPAPLTQNNLTIHPGPQRPPLWPTGEAFSTTAGTPPNPRMQPPPASMPAFPGTPAPLASNGPVPPPAPSPPPFLSPPGTP